MMIDKIFAYIAIIAGSVLIGLHFDSPLVAIGSYLCCIGVSRIAQG